MRRGRAWATVAGGASITWWSDGLSVLGAGSAQEGRGTRVSRSPGVGRGHHEPGWICRRTATRERSSGGHRGDVVDCPGNDRAKRNEVTGSRKVRYVWRGGAPAIERPWSFVSGADSADERTRSTASPIVGAVLVSPAPVHREVNGIASRPLL